MKNIKNILGMGAFMLLASLAVSSCTEKSDWDIDSSYKIGRASCRERV